MDIYSFSKQSICVERNAKMDFFSKVWPCVYKIQRSLWLKASSRLFPKTFLFSAMPTLLRRVQHYINASRLPRPVMPAPEQYKELQEKILAAFLLSQPPPPPALKHPIEHYYREINGEQVIAYPRYFRPALDEHIKEYFASLPLPRRIRERVPIKKKPVFSSKAIHKT
jgi:hypothetical protein